jgi:hypothetical protein
MRLLFSFLMLGTASFPAWRMTQPVRDESNSSVKRRGKGVGEGSKVGEGSGATVAGIGVGGGVEVGKNEGAMVGVAGMSPKGDAQADIKRRSPNKRIFFMLFLIAKRTTLR